MNEFERKMLSMMENLDSKVTSMDSRLTNMDNRLTNIEKRMSSMEERMSNMENDISELKEHAEVTRVAANDSGEKLEQLVMELKNQGIIA